MATYEPLEPGFTAAVGGKSIGFDTSTTPSLFTSTSFLYTLFFVIIVVAASGRYAIAGLYRMEATKPGIQKSNEIFKRVTLGLLGVFSLWLILATVNKDLLSGDVGLRALHINGSTGGSGLAQSGVGASAGTKTSTVTQNTGGADDATRKRLNSAGISINKADCTDPSQTDCTSLDNLPEDTISMLLSLRQACSGNITVTGGTEAGHASHGKGKYPVDISQNDSNLNSCISKGQSTTGPGAGSAYSNFGYIFWLENGGSAVHWHVYK